MNDLLAKDKTILTPIEAALGIDEDGKVSARKLYEFLELDKGNFARWAKTNIAENQFATENIDFSRFFIQEEAPMGGYLQREDFKLSIEFAKKLCMISKSLKGEEARNYFIKIEGKLKQVAVSISQLPPELQMFKQIFDSQAKMYLEHKRLEKMALEAKQEVESVNEKFTAVKETFAEHKADDWRKWVNSTFAKMNLKTGQSYSELKNDSYELLAERTGVKLAIRVNNARDRLKEAGATKATIEAYVTLSAIEDDKKLKELYTSILKEMSVKYLV